MDQKEFEKWNENMFFKYNNEGLKNNFHYQSNMKYKIIQAFFILFFVWGVLGEGAFAAATSKSAAIKSAPIRFAAIKSAAIKSTNVKQSAVKSATAKKAIVKKSVVKKAVKKAVKKKIVYKPPEIGSYFVALDGGEKLQGKNFKKELPVASLTKMMTALVFIENRVKEWNETIAYQPDKHFVYGNYLKLADGDALTVKDLLYSILVGSVNEPARMLVDATNLSEKEFIEKMNYKAAALGMENTKYVDTSGISPENISTSEYQAKLLEAIFAESDLREAMQTKHYEFVEAISVDKNEEHHFNHTNSLLGKTNFEILASKTGYLDEAKNNLAMVVQKNGRLLYVVTMADPSRYNDFTNSKKLVDKL